jgi:hypothetical protein
MENFMFNNQGNCFSQRINNDQSINERNKIVDEFMNYIDNKNNINNNWDDEEEDDFDKIEHEYMKKKNEEAKIKYYEDYNKIKENEEIEEKEIINDKYNRKIEYDFYNNEENNIKSNIPKQFFPRLYQNPENLYLYEANKYKEKQKIKKLYERKNKKNEYEDLNNFKNLINRQNKNKEIDKGKKQNIRIFKTGKKTSKESRSLSKTKFKNGKNEDTKNQEENESFEEIKSLLSKYRNNKGGVKSGRIRRPSNKEKKLFENFQNVNNNIWNNNLNNYNFQSNIQQYEVNKLKNDFILPPIYNPIQSKYNNIFNGNKTFTTFSNMNGININYLNDKNRSKSKNKNTKKNYEDNISNNNQIQFDVILNHFDKKE